MHLLCFLSFMWNSSHLFSLNIQASWCQTWRCWAVVAITEQKHFFLKLCLRAEPKRWPWLMHHAECWDPSRAVGGALDQVLMSKSCHCPLLEKALWFYLVELKKVNLSKEHCRCAFCSRCISTGNSCVHSPSWSREPAAHAAFEDVVYALQRWLSSSWKHPVK